MSYSTLPDKLYKVCVAIIICITKLGLVNVAKRGRKKRYEGGILHIRLPLGIIEKIERLAEQRGESKSDYVRRVLMTAATDADQQYQTTLTETFAPLKKIIEKVVQELSQNPDLLKSMLEKGLQKIANMYLEAMFKEQTISKTNNELSSNSS